MDRMDGVKAHFDEEAEEYDGIIRKLIPRYEDMVEALVDAIPRRDGPLAFADLGCGTGTVSRAVLDAFSGSQGTCVDISATMLEIARRKTAGADMAFLQDDFADLELGGGLDAVVSSLALHHLEDDASKAAFYRRMAAWMKPGAVFVNADVILAEDPAEQESNMEQWTAWMEANCDPAEVRNKWLPAYYREDRPASLVFHRRALADVGLGSFEVVWKRYNFAVWRAVKG